MNYDSDRQVSIKLFKSIGESHHVPGLRELHALSDVKVAKAMAENAKADGAWPAHDYRSATARRIYNRH